MRSRGRRQKHRGQCIVLAVNHLNSVLIPVMANTSAPPAVINQDDSPPRIRDLILTNRWAPAPLTGTVVDQQQFMRYRAVVGNFPHTLAPRGLNSNPISKRHRTISHRA